MSQGVKSAHTQSGPLVFSGSFSRVRSQPLHHWSRAWEGDPDGAWGPGPHLQTRSLLSPLCASLGHIGCKPSPRVGFKNSCFILGKICPPLRTLSSLFFWLIFLRRKELWTSPNTTYVGFYPGLPYLLIAKKGKEKKTGKFWKQSFLNPSGAISQSFFSALLQAEEHTVRATK